MGTLGSNHSYPDGHYTTFLGDTHLQYYALRADKLPANRQPVAWPDFRYLMNARAMVVIPAIRKALRIGFQEHARQKDNHLFQRDMLEVARQYHLDLYNQHYLRAQEAFVRGRKPAYQRHRDACLALLDYQVRILEAARNWPDFSFAARWKAARGGAYKTVDRWHALTWMAGVRPVNGKLAINDNYFYWRSDFLEPVRDLWRPWVRAYFAYLDGLMAKGVRRLPSAQNKGVPENMARYWGEFGYQITDQAKGTLTDVYRKIAYDFADKPFTVGQVGEIDAGDPVPVIRQVFDEIARRGLATFDDLP